MIEHIIVAVLAVLLAASWFLLRWCVKLIREADKIFAMYDRDVTAIAAKVEADAGRRATEPASPDERDEDELNTGAECQCSADSHPLRRNLMEGEAGRHGEVCELGWPIMERSA